MCITQVNTYCEALNLPADNHCKSPYNCICIISVRHNCRIFMKSPNEGGGGGGGGEGGGGGKGGVGGGGGGGGEVM